jgi:hypothetical protein
VLVKKGGNRREASVSKVVATIDSGFISASKVVDIQRDDADTKRTRNSTEPQDENWSRGLTGANTKLARGFKPIKRKNVSSMIAQSMLQV